MRKSIDYFHKINFKIKVEIFLDKPLILKPKSGKYLILKMEIKLKFSYTF
jgi:hypothetical protein